MSNSRFAFLVCFFPRLAYLLFYQFFPSLVSRDLPSHQWKLSSSLLHSGRLLYDGKVTVLFEPFYAIFLAFARLVTGDRAFFVLLLQITLASAGGIYFKKILDKFFSVRAALFGLLIFAFYPYSVRHSIKFFEGPLLTTFLIAACYYTFCADSPRRAAKAGLAWGLAILTRAMVLPAWTVAALVLIAKRKFLPAFWLGFVALAVCAPLFARNYFLSGSLFPARSGLNLLKANNPYYDKVMPSADPDLLENYAYETLERERPGLLNADEISKDRFFRDKAMEFIRQNPSTALRFRLLNLGWFFSPSAVPAYPLGEVFVTFNADGLATLEHSKKTFPARGKAWAGILFLFRGFILMTAAIGFFLRRKFLWKQDAVLAGLLLNFILVYCVFAPTTRYADPVMFVLIFYSAAAWDAFSRIPTGQWSEPITSG